MSQLTAEQLDVLIKLLGAQESLLVAGVDEHVAALRGSRAAETTTPVGDIADQAERELVRDRQLAVVDHDLRALTDIQAARGRLADGSINRCVDCANDIGFERLQAYPTAVRCVLCQDRYEQAQRLAVDVAT